MRLLGNDPDLGAATPEDDLPAYPAPDYTIDETGRYVDASSRAADPSDSRPVEADNQEPDPSEGPPAVVVPEPEPLAGAVEQDPVDGDSVLAPADPALVEPAPVVDPDQPPLLLDAADHTGDWGFAADPVTPEAPSLAQFGWDSEVPSDPEPPAWTAGRDLFEPPAPAAEDTTALPWFLHDDPAPDESLNQPADSLAAQEADPDALDARMDELATPAQETWDAVPPEEPTDLPPVTDDVPATPSGPSRSPTMTCSLQRHRCRSPLMWTGQRSLPMVSAQPTSYLKKWSRPTFLPRIRGSSRPTPSPEQRRSRSSGLRSTSRHRLSRWTRSRTLRPTPTGRPT